MSNTPSSATALSRRDADVASHEHDELLGWLWANAETVVPGLYHPNEEWKKKAVAEYAQSYRHFFDKVRQVTPKEDQKEALAYALAACVERVGDVGGKHIPDELCLARLTKKQFEEEIVQVKQGTHGESKTEILGFVDMTCEVAVPSHLAQQNSLFVPIPFGSLDGEVGNGGPVDVGRVIAKLGEVADPAPRSWAMKVQTRKAWFDVRAKLPTLGQLIREVKHLANHADDDTDIFVVVASLPPQYVSILEHEGFRVIQRASYF